MLAKCCFHAPSACRAGKYGPAATVVAQRPAAGLTFDPLRKARASVRAAAAGTDYYDDADLISDPKEFAAMQLEEVQDNILARQADITMLMEEVRRLRIQLKLRGVADEDIIAPAEAGFPAATELTKRQDIIAYASGIVGITLIGGILLPIIEAKIGMGGAGYYDFITRNGLPAILAEVDPMLAAHAGGAVGVLTSLLMMEANNTKMLTPLYALAVGAITLVSSVITLNLESKLSLTGSNYYYNMIASMHLPTVLAEVDPITSSIVGGGVGALTAMLVSEILSTRKETRTCRCCEGTGYLTCGNCSGTGVTGGRVTFDDALAPIAPPAMLAAGPSKVLDVSSSSAPAPKVQLQQMLPQMQMLKPPAAWDLVSAAVASRTASGGDTAADSPRNLFLSAADAAFGRSGSASPAASRNGGGWDREDEWGSDRDYSPRRWSEDRDYSPRRSASPRREWSSRREAEEERRAAQAASRRRGASPAARRRVTPTPRRR